MQDEPRRNLDGGFLARDAMGHGSSIMQDTRLTSSAQQSPMHNSVKHSDVFEDVDEPAGCPLAVRLCEKRYTVRPIESAAGVGGGATSCGPPKSLAVSQ